MDDSTIQQLRPDLSTLLLILVLIAWTSTASGDDVFPVTPEVFIDEPFSSCEGIAFNGEGRLFVTCNRKVWEVGLDGNVRAVADVGSHLGLAGYDDKDLLVADFGPTNVFDDGRNSDGVVWRISPDGEKKPHATGIPDPNFVLVREDKSYLVSDDGSSDIYLVTPKGEVSLYSTAVNHPNGMALSSDGSTLYVAQIFTNIRPVVGTNKLWAMRLEDGRPLRDAHLVAQCGPNAFADGLAMDDLGRVYIAANREGRIWRYDPATESMVLIAEGMYGIASLAFGEGVFDRQSIYATTTYSMGRGGKLWRVPVGATGASLHR